jgi:tungstate transport system ATP-binding protein
MLDRAASAGGGLRDEPGAAVPAIIELRDLGFEIAGRGLIGGIDLQVRAGRRLAIMGANGAGKSLLVRLMHGLLKPTTGEVLWRGRPLDRAARDRQAMVFQRPVLLRRSVTDNLRFALAVRGVDRAERAEKSLVARARLSDLARQPARTLSGGEQQRLTVARALVGEPELVLLDEPTASLDPASTLAIETLITGARESGVAVVLVTHDAGQARRICDDIAFLHAGRLVEFGPTERVLGEPKSEAARAWIEGRLHLES